MSADDGFGWRGIVVPAYGPTFLSAGAAGAVLPIAALRADELGGADHSALLKYYEKLTGTELRGQS